MYATQKIRNLHSIQKIHKTEGQNYQKQLHQHPHTAEILLITNGQGWFTINKKSYPVRPGSVVLYNAGDWHEETADSRLPFSVLSLCCSGHLQEGLPSNHIRAPHLAPVQPLKGFKALENLFMQIYEENSSSYPNKRQMIYLLISQFFESLARSLGQVPANAAPDHMQLVYLIQHFIEENHQRELTLETISLEVGLSKYYVARLFKDLKGVSPIQYMIKCRLETAKRLLETGTESISAIARQTGYKSETHFQQAFKKAVSVTPGAYRRTHLSKETK